jgi:hypothetical protein
MHDIDPEDIDEVDEVDAGEMLALVPHAPRLRMALGTDPRRVGRLPGWL